MVRIFFIAILGAVHGCGLALSFQEVPPVVPHSEEKAELAGQSAVLPVTIASTQILVEEVYVNGTGPFRFLLDTGGMGDGRIDVSLVEKLKLEKKGDVLAGDGTSREPRPMPVYELDSITIGNATWRNLRMLSRDYNAHGAAEVRGHIDGVLGFALLEPFLTTIDYGGRAITLERGALPEPNGKDVWSMEHDGIPGLEVRIAGRPHRARLDTGAMGAIMVSAEIAASLDFAKEPDVIAQARTMSGSFDVKRAPLRGNVEFAGHLLENPDITFGGPVQGVNVGGQVLRDYVVTYDQRNRRVRLIADRGGHPRRSARATWLPLGPITVSMPLEHGRPTIEAFVNGRGPFRFVLDTGAEGLTLDTEVVKNLGLIATGKTRVGDPAAPEAVEVDTYQLDSVAVGDAKFERVDAIGLGGMRQIGYDGIIGTPFFQDALVELDYRKQTMTLRRGALPRNAHAVDFRWDAGYVVTLPIDVAGQTLDTHVDTGNPGLLSVPMSLKDKLAWSAPPQLRGKAHTISGEFEVHAGILDGSVSFAGVTIDRPTIQLNDRFAWGNLGSAALQNKVLTIDQPNQRLMITPAVAGAPNENPTAVDAPRPRYGMALAFAPDSIRVEQVMSGGLAEQGGLKSGDLIRSIGGAAVESLDHARIDQLLRQSPLELTVERTGVIVKLTLGAR